MDAQDESLSVSQNYTILKNNHQIFKSFNPTEARFDNGQWHGMGCKSDVGLTPSIKFTQDPFVLGKLQR